MAPTLQSALPGGVPTVIVDTTAGAMMQDGLYDGGMPMMQSRRQFRRAPQFGSEMQGGFQGGMQGGMVPGRSETDEHGNVVRLGASQPILVKKLD